jgi:peptidoglycan/LPS O-acetylase OafA/YrhL
VAATLVFVCHAATMWTAAHGHTSSRPVTYLGRFGVAIFFVISGLVIYRPFVVGRHTGRPPDIWAYAVRRLTRIVPPYWIALAFCVVVIPSTMIGVREQGIGRFAAFGQIYAPETYYGGLAVAWTLAIEMTFYAAVPLLAYAAAHVDRCRARPLEPLLLVALGLASVDVRVTGANGGAAGTILGYFGWFAVGMLLARRSAGAAPTKPPLSARLTWALAAAGYVLLTAHLPAAITARGNVLDASGLALLGGLVVLPAISHDGPARLKWLGDRSYGVYLWHFPILVWLGQRHLAGTVYVGAAISLTLAAAHFSYVYVEQPLMRRAGDLSRRRRTSPPHAAAAAAAAVGLSPPRPEVA